MHLVIESVATVQGNKINGVALTPTTSLNGNNYLPDIIDHAGNIGVTLDNLNWEHTSEKIGNVKFTVDPNTHTMYYEGVVTSPTRIQSMKNGNYKVSIEAQVNEVAKTCSPNICYNTPMDMKMEGLGITDRPGVLSTTLNILESYQDWTPIQNNHCKECLVKEQDLRCPTCGQFYKMDATHTHECSQTMTVSGSGSLVLGESEELKKKVEELEARLDKALTCSKCGGIKKI